MAETYAEQLRYAQLPRTWAALEPLRKKKEETPDAPYTLRDRWTAVRAVWATVRDLGEEYGYVYSLTVAPKEFARLLWTAIRP